LSVKPVGTRSRRLSASGRLDTVQVRKFGRIIIQLGRERDRLEEVFQKASRMAEKKPFHHA
jgi:hypothetical protein